MTHQHWAMLGQREKWLAAPAEQQKQQACAYSACCTETQMHVAGQAATDMQMKLHHAVVLIFTHTFMCEVLCMTHMHTRLMCECMQLHLCLSCNLTSTTLGLKLPIPAPAGVYALATVLHQ